MRDLTFRRWNHSLAEVGAWRALMSYGSTGCGAGTLGSSLGCGAAWSFGWGDLLRGVERLRSAPRTRSKEPRVYVSECDLYEYMFDSKLRAPRRKGRSCHLNRLARVAKAVGGRCLLVRGDAFQLIKKHFGVPGQLDFTIVRRV